MKSYFKIFITGIWIGIFSLSFLFSSANNIRINGTVQVSQGTGDTLVLSFPLRWDNSWRDQFNWDAAWVFLKFKSGTGDWNHVNLCAGGHSLVNTSGQPVPFSYMTGNTGSSTVGIFVYRNTLEAGNTPEITCQIKCLKSSLGGLMPSQFASHEAFVLAQAVEMVYVPYGAYYLGDGSCANRFAGPDKNPILIDNEEAITAATVTKVYPVTNNVTGSAQSIAAVYPKGYKGFYMMKYEASQEQWVYFLNTLTYVQQQERVPGLPDMKSGEYIFGSKSEPNNRNGIIVAEPSDNGSAVTFANNLHNDDKYAQDDDGKTIACNYLSPSDMLAYCSWAGLRPMSEMEYEKACRRSYPEPAVPDEYAWHDNNISGRLGAVSNDGMRNERSNTVNANVNAGNTFGPVRCGLFATGSSTQQTAGAAFWGGMELSGNLKEMCCNLTYSGFNGSTMGAGSCNTGLWSITPTHFGVRGGGFTSPDNLLRVSDRTEMTGYFTDFNKKDSTVGFRGVRTIDNGITVTQGALIAKVGGNSVTNVCPGTMADITTNAPAKVMSGGTEVPDMDFTYTWYDSKGNSIPGETGAVLHFNNFVVSGTAASISYLFKRKATCLLGDVTAALTLTMPNVNLSLTTAEVSVDACDFTSTVTASTYCSNPVYTWSHGSNWSKTGNTYVPNREDLNHAGDFTVNVTVSSEGCTSEKQQLKVHIPYVQKVNSDQVTMSNCGNVIAIDGRDNKRYCTAKIGTQCWMGKNLDVGSYQVTSGDYRKFDEAGIQKWCQNNIEANCTKYGGLYEWWEAVCGGKCNGNLTTGNADLSLISENQLITYGARMVPGSTTQVQGICPDGWHISSDEDWIVLERYMGMSDSEINKFDSRGTNEGSKMKIPGTFNGYSWCNGSDCNSSGLGMKPGGTRSPNGGDFMNLDIIGSWWLSTPSYIYARFRRLNYGETTVGRQNTYRSAGRSIRCVRN